MSKKRRDPQCPFGWHLRRLMDANGFESDGELEKASGVDQSLLSKWQAGTARPSVDNLRKIAGPLKTRVGDLMVAAELATPEELGMVGQPPKLPTAKIHEVLARAAVFLNDEHLTQAMKDHLVRVLHEGIDYWLNRNGAPVPPSEPTEADRSRGKKVTRRA